MELLEKIVAWAAGVLVVLTLGVYLYLGLPSTTAVSDLPQAVEVPVEAKPAVAPSAIPSPIPPEDKAILDKLATQGVRVAPNAGLPTKRYTVPTQTFEHISREVNWIPELKKLASDPIPGNARDTRRRISNIQSDSILKKLGFEDNDVIELINGEVVEFSESKSFEYREKFRKALDTIRQGQSISITVTRGGKPLHLKFALPSS